MYFTMDFVTILLFLVPVVFTKKILIIPYEHLAHERYFGLAGNALTENGHDVHMLISRHADFLKKDFPQIKLLYPHFVTKAILDDLDFFVKFEFEEGHDLAKGFKMMCKNSVERCVDILNDVAFIKTLDLEKYDLIIIDGSDFARCLYTIPYKLGIPYITLLSRVDPWSAVLPAIPGLEPVWGSWFDPKTSSLMERIHSLIQYVKLYTFMPPSNIYKDEIILKYAPEKETTTFTNLFKQSEMWLVHSDPICLDWHRISASHYQFIGGLGVTEPKPLPEEIDMLFKSTSNDIILVTFGSALVKLPEDFLQTLFNGLANSNYNVIMQQKFPERHTPPPNVHLFSWVPQNDILGHPKTKLFITHGGNNGQMEGIFHAVPMITIPVYGDQMYNAYRSKVRGYSVTLDPHTLTEDQLRDAVEHVMTTPSYKHAVANCSAITKSLPSSKERLVLWVNHILQFGGDHLKPRYMDKPLYEIFMLDVMALLFGAISLLICSAYCLCNRCFFKTKIKIE